MILFRKAILVATALFLASSLNVCHAEENSGSSSDPKSLCDRLRPNELPSECICSEPGNYHVVVQCIKPFKSEYFNDTIGMKLDIDVCNDAGSQMSLDVTEKNHGIDFPISSIRAGEEKNIPIPGLAVIVPPLGSFGVDATVLIAGNPDHLRLKVGLNACLQTHHKDICASAVPGLSKLFPWYILKGTYSFGNVCNSSSTVVTGWDAIQ